MPDTEASNLARGRLALVAAASGSAGAGLVHLAAAGDHQGDAVVAWLFSICATAQLGWTLAVLAKPRRAIVLAGVLINVAALAAWLMSRTAGWPLIESMAEPEAVGVQDLVAALLAAGAVTAALLVVLRPALSRSPRPARRAAFAAVGLVIAVPAAAAAPSHTHGTDHAHDVVAESTPESEGHDHPQPPPPTGPIVSLDDPRLTHAQRGAAQDLISRTAAGMAPFRTVEAVTAAGYRSIGDGGVSEYEHFVNWSYLDDGRDLDPDRIESIVARSEPDGTKTVVSAMYILAPGRTMADVPDIAGELTTWHDHQNLCWRGRALAGVAVNGVCPEGSVLVATSPMLHVWLVPHECGPFAGIETHGVSCHEH